MKTIMINGNLIEYPSKKEIMESNSTETDKNKMLYRFGESISTLLGIDCPDIVLTGSIQRDSSTNLDAVVLTKKDDPSLKHPVIFINNKMSEEKIIFGTLAHEIRHVYQDQHPDMFQRTFAYSFNDSLFDEREIDADAFSIYMISEIYHMPIQKAAFIFCYDIEQNNKIAYLLRIEKAKEIFIDSIIKG